jgi:glycosyltransferase involved in cell wall biosynthesis
MGWFCERLSERGHSLHVLTSDLKDSSCSRSHSGQVEPRLCFVRDHEPALALLRKSLANRQSVRRAIKEIQPDIVFCGGFDGIGFNAYLAAIESGRPTFTWLGDTWLGQAWRDLRRYDQWSGLAATDQRRGIKSVIKNAIGRYGRLRRLYDGPQPRSFAPVGTLSQFVMDDLRRSGAPVSPDARVVPVSLHPRFFDSNDDPVGHSGIRTNSMRALFVGRMEMPKGPDTAIRAVAAARRQGADVRLTFAGIKLQGLRKELEAIAGALGITEYVEYKGTPDLDQLRELYRHHDVFLFPSRIIEGLGVVNVEALACGLPIIGTAHSGSAEVIIEGESGFRVDKEDFEAMGRHLVLLQTNRELLERLSRSAPCLARRFAPSKVIDALEEELQGAIRNYLPTGSKAP